MAIASPNILFLCAHGTISGKFFVTALEIKSRYGEKSKEILWEAIGLYTYLKERVKVGLMQLMDGARKWKLDLLNRNDLVSLTERATKVTGIPLVEDTEQDVIEKILG